MRVIILLLLTTVSFSCFAETEPWQEGLGPSEFRDLVHRASLKVDVFESVWAHNDRAEIWGGTSRDFASFVRRAVAKATTKTELDAITHELTTRKIEAAEFIGYFSDFDVASRGDGGALGRQPGARRAGA